MLNETVKIKFQRKIKFSSVKNTFSFPGSSRNIKRTLSSRTSPGRLLLKLIYWNESIQRINIIITTDEYQEQSPTIVDKFPRRQLWGGIWFQKSWYHTLAWISSRELFEYCHNLQLLFWNFSIKISLDKNLLCGKLLLVTQYLLVRMLSAMFSCKYFRYFQ